MNEVQIYLVIMVLFFIKKCKKKKKKKKKSLPNLPIFFFQHVTLNIHVHNFFILPYFELCCECWSGPFLSAFVTKVLFPQWASHNILRRAQLIGWLIHWSTNSKKMIILTDLQLINHLIFCVCYFTVFTLRIQTSQSFTIFYLKFGQV